MLLVVGLKVSFGLSILFYCLSTILLHCCNVLYIGFSYFSVRSLVGDGKRLTAKNACTFSIYELLFITTIVLPLLSWTSIAFFVTSFCFSCFMT